MRSKLLAALAIITITIFSCKKDDTAPVITPPSTLAKVDTLGAWQKIYTDLPHSGLEDVWFTDAATGYTCGANFIAKSIDSGKTWQQTSFSDTYYNIFFYNSSAGFILGTQSIAITKDGGNTWISKYTLPVHSNAIGDIYFTSSSTGYLRSSLGLYKTTDTCNTWQKMYAGNILGLSFFSTTNGNIIAGKPTNSDTSATTSDGGMTWQKNGTFNTQGDTTSYTVLQFTDANTGWFNFGPNLYKTINAGNSWSAVGPQVQQLQDINMFDDMNGYIASSDAIYQTTNGGASWQRVCKNAFAGIIEIHFIDANTGWACGYDTLSRPLLLRYKL